jgi:adenosine deaminase
VRSIEDSNVLRLLRQRNVALEMCPTSNIQTGVVQHFWHHPLPDLLALGVPLSINTDDPSVSDTTLTDEYWVAMQAMRVSLAQIKQTIVTAAEVSFQPPEERALLADWFRKELRLGPDQ